MKKSYIATALAAGVVALSVPALALLPVNRNALGNAPLMGVFSKPATEAEQLAQAKADEAKARAEAAKAPAAKAAVEVADGTPLPSIIATVYDYASGSIGTYRLPEVSGGELTKVSDVSSYYGGALSGNLFYACHDGRFADYWDSDYDPHGHRIQAYDINTWEPVGNEVYVSDYRASDLAIHPATGKGYAFCDYGSMMYKLYEIDLSDGSQTVHASPSTMFPDESSRALAFDSDGQLWGVTKAGMFGKVSLEDGVNSGDYSLGVEGDLQHGWTADFDPDSGNFIFIYNYSDGYGLTDNRTIVYSIVPATGEMTPLATFDGKCITSMFIAADPVDDAAPAAPSVPVASFSEGSLSGQLVFTMPSELNAGGAASGSATWTVAEGKEVLATGSAAYGAEVKADVTVASAGKHSFSVWASNDAGDGKKSRLTAWVGPDVPLAPASVSVLFSEADNKFEVSWEAVTAGANGGWVNPADVRYTVVRNPGEVTVADKISETSLTDIYAPEGIENITYSVTASQGDLSSAPAVSDPVVTGSLALPYTMSDNLNNSNYGENWTIIDSNGDGTTWKNQYQSVVYSYNSSNPADDWLISPPINGIGGCKYSVKIIAHAQGWSEPSNYPERIEVKMGNVASAEGMNVEVLGPTMIDHISSNPQVVEFDLVPAEDGKFFFGIHAISDANQYNLTIKDVTIAAPVSDEAPGTVTDMVLTPDPSGALSLTGSALAPAKTANGHTLPSIEKIEVMRDGTLVATVTDAVPGERFTFSDDNITTEGEKVYTAVAYSAAGAGPLSEQFKTYVGVNIPGEVSDLVLTETADGQVTASWTAPAADRDGYPLKGKLTYSVEVFPDNAYYHGNATYEGITGTSHTFTPAFDGDRDHGFVYVKVRATSAKGTGYFTQSANYAVGAPCKLPFKESFPNYTLEHPWGDGESNGPQIASITDDERSLAYQQFNGWNRMMDKSFQSADGSQDGDNGFAGMFGWSYVDDDQGNYHNEWTELLSPKIDLSGTDSPVLTFYTYNWLNINGKDLNELQISVIPQGEEPVVVKDIVIGDLGNVQAWEFVAVDLSAFAGKTVSLVFKGTIKAQGDNGYNWILIDNIRIESVSATDLGIDAITAPVEAKPGEPFKVSARITNLGARDVAAHSATLLKNGAAVETLDLGPLAFSSSHVVEFTHTLSVNDPVGNTMQISVLADGDENEANNLSAEATVGRNLQLLPEPRNVRFSTPEADAVAWDEPDMAAALPAPFTDDFESYGDIENTLVFATEAGDWTFIDRDHAPIGGIVSSSTWELIEFPGIPTHSEQSWWVQSRLFEEFNNDYFGYSGLQYLANMYVTNSTFTEGAQQDDWAISPLLCGKEQMISIMARSYDRTTPETIELLWSDGSLNPDDFTLARRIEEVAGDWTQYIFVVPEGARRFAIRGCSYAPMGTNQCFIDDVTFVPADGEPRALTLIGYNIYRGNTLVNTTPVADLTVTLPSAIAADELCYVSAVYDKGESRAVQVGAYSGLDSSLAARVSVTSRNGHIIISGLDAADYTVAATSGVIIASGNATGTVTIPATTGVYLVKTSGTVIKTIVR